MTASRHEATFAGEHPELARALAGQFQVEREIGRGGMGVVYLAYEERLDRLVALKVLPAALAGENDNRERFLREARTAARLAHPNVVPVYRADEAGGTAFFAMAFVDGQSLAERVAERGPLSPAEAVPILRDVAWALAYAHARGVVHRDVKPENILLERASGRTLVTDFGIAQHSMLSDQGARLTRGGHLLGTLHYMSPEQVDGAVLDGRSDLYALGVVAYFILSGRLPFEGLAGAAVLVAHATRPAPPLLESAPGVPRALAAVVARCLAKRPEDRYPTGEALAKALEHALAETGAVPGKNDTFPPGLPERVDETQAAAIWRRAAQLQADALHRLETRDSLRSVTQGVALRERGAAHPATSTPDTPAAGYRLADVAMAAEEVGISRQYVAMALAELPRGTLPGELTQQVGERGATRYLGTDMRSLAATVEINAAPARVLRALGVVLQQAPYELQLRSTVGGHPLDGGVIVFELPGPIVGAAGAPASSVNTYWMATHQALEAHQLQVTLRAVSGDAGTTARTALTMTADLRPGVRSNIRASKWIAGASGTGAAFFTGAILAKGAAVVASAAVLAPAIGVLAGVAGLSLLGYRSLYRSSVGKAAREMERALNAVASAVQSEEVFGTLPGPGRALRGGGDDDESSAVLMSVIS